MKPTSEKRDIIYSVIGFAIMNLNKTLKHFENHGINTKEEVKTAAWISEHLKFLEAISRMNDEAEYYGDSKINEYFYNLIELDFKNQPKNAEIIYDELFKDPKKYHDVKIYIPKSA